MSAINIPGFGVAPASGERAVSHARRITMPWPRLALGLIAALAAFLNFFQLSREGYANTFYAAAVKSMSMSWHNFFFAALDPSAFVTIDKPPLGFWFQVASVKLFGFSGVSLLAPEALAGVLSVLLLYHLVTRVFGQAAGLLAALFLALTPVAVADNRNNTIDSILVLFMLLGAWAISRAVESRPAGASRWAGFRWLLLCAVFVGLGFNIKMLEAYLVVPAFGLVYLLGAQPRLRTRLLHLFLATIVMLTISLSWAVAVDLTPASQRPYVDSTSTNSEIDLAIGYNGLQRLLGQVGTSSAHASTTTSTTRTSSATSTGAAITAPLTGTASLAAGSGSSASTTQGTTGTSQGPQGSGNGGGSGGGLFNNGAAGPLRLIDSELGGQAGWLFPLAVIGLVVAACRRIRLPLDRKQKGLVIWGGWLLTMAAFYSVAGFFHSYYLVTIAPAIAALAAIGLVTLWQDYRQYRSLRSVRGWMLPVALLVTAAAQVHILSGFSTWSTWMTPIILATTVVPAVALAAARLRPRRRLPIWTPIAVGVGSLALLFAPTVWAANTVSATGSSIPSAGPSVQSSFGGGSGGFAGMPQRGEWSSERPAFGTGGTPGQAPAGGTSGQAPAGGTAGQMPSGGMSGRSGTNSQIISYLLQHQGSTYYLLVTSNSQSAAPYIIATGKPVMSLGGFGGNDPILTLAQFESLVKSNTVRYVLAGGGGGGMGGGSSITQWVQASCKAVSLGGTQSGLYDCAGA